MEIRRKCVCRMEIIMHESGEMYLETIYVLSQNSQSVRSLDVAEHMGFSKPSVSRAIGLLKKEYQLSPPHKVQNALNSHSFR